MDNNEKTILNLLEISGPLTGKELLRQIRLDEFTLWRICKCSEFIITKIIGKRYLRLDAQVNEYARLSPSIMREFYGYTVIGTVKQALKISERAELLQKEIEGISNNKFNLAGDIVSGIVDSQKDSAIINEKACFMIAGDVVYSMAHGEPRPESSTGELVRGSDLDIIVVTVDMPQEFLDKLDSDFYDAKYKWLMNPAGREEIDYIIKDISMVKKQLSFSEFKYMIASKILEESLYLYGNKDIFNNIREMIMDKDIPQKLFKLKKKAELDRKNAESYLLGNVDSITRDEWLKLFYTKEEKEEIF